MRFTSQLVVILAGLATVHAAAYIDTRALGKANEYEKENCLGPDGSNTPKFHHKPVCGCVRMDAQTVSVYIATSPGQTVSAYTNTKCYPGKSGQEQLGSMGGNCHPLDDEFTAGRIQSLLYHVHVLCTIEDLVKDVAHAVVETVEGIIIGVGATVKGLGEAAEAAVRV
ncbi:hypothetical protein EG327_002208 [Venturia inaequalis]|uniref:Uncharacterized protein n=1 Tax=Venturia inaequalis TaxID=5025 RepID=A0A8H3VKV3_VENIN|nr:hypothetical protein EG327_002208 [Venturia inaequalis]